MKIQIKTLTQKSIFLDVDENKTVLELKELLELYPDVGVKPESQKLIYAGKILNNEDKLSVYNIDDKKFLVVMVLKKPQNGSASTSKATVKASSSEIEVVPSTSTGTRVEAQKIADTKSMPAAGAAAAAAAAVATAVMSAGLPPKVNTEELVENIVGMGYPESEVRAALAASYNNAERAIEYLIEGIPSTTSLASAATGDSSYTDSEYEISPFEALRNDPLFRDLRHAIQQHPDLLEETVQSIGEANPTILNLINANQQEFLNMLMEPSDDEDDEN